VLGPDAERVRGELEGSCGWPRAAVR
jgi:hypothetical protein